MKRLHVPVHELAYAAGKDAGNRSMRAAGRDGWNDDDYRAAIDAYNAVIDSVLNERMRTNA